MSSAIHPSFASASAPNRQQAPQAHHGAIPIAASNVPTGTFVPGTKVQVGGHRVVVEKYLSEGGFAHVYVVRLPKPVNGEDKAVLKRVAVPDKEALTSMRTEVETMKRLKGHKYIVTYIDSHASQLKGGGYEVFLLMEYCSGGGLIDFMNTRLQNRLTEPEIVKIFSDTALGVAAMHYLQPPLLHRDLKVENILISNTSSSKLFKLCDFGSAAPPRPAATNAAEGRLIEEDVQKHTTIQYRSPEMIDVYRRQPIDEKSDIWALGVLLYKLCYYTTPFEEKGQMAILNASFKYPGYPAFSDRLKKLIAMLLQEKPHMRPNIYQVIREVCSMRGADVPLKDIYAGRSASEARRNQQLPPTPSQSISPPVVGAYKAAPIEEKVTLPDITPMRRGRPTKAGSESVPGKPGPSPRRPVASDPFAALDGPTATADLDEVSARFPSLDQFSLLHESGNKFSLDQPSQTSSDQPKPISSNEPKDLSQRVTEALADDAFAFPQTTKKDIPTHSKSVPSLSNQVHTSTQTNVRNSQQFPSTPAIPKKSTMISTGTMTSPPTSPPDNNISQFPRQIFKFPPTDHRSSSHSRVPDVPRPEQARDSNLLQRPALLDHRSKSQTATISLANPSVSARPSLEGQRPDPEFDDLTRSRSTNSRNRPINTQLDSGIRPKARSSSRSKLSDGGPSPRLIPTSTGDFENGIEATQITSNVEFLRAMEEEDPGKKKEKRNSAGAKHNKRSSMPSISLSGTKSLLAGRFGEAFRRFETNGPNKEGGNILDDSNLTPIAGSEATDGRSDDGQMDESQELSPEVRRELERQRLAQEERRVSEAAAKYKQQVAEGARAPRGKDNSRATLIQNKVQSLLVESSKPSPTKTAEGYGRFTNSPAPMPSPKLPPPQPSLSRQTFPIDKPSVSAPATDRPFARPSAPPKPQGLRTGGRGGEPSMMSPPVASKPSSLAGRPPAGAPKPFSPDASIDVDDWEASFGKRYPSLSGLEMVETEIDKGVKDI